MILETMNVVNVVEEAEAEAEVVVEVASRVVVAGVETAGGVSVVAGAQVTDSLPGRRPHTVVARHLGLPLTHAVLARHHPPIAGLVHLQADAHRARLRDISLHPAVAPYLVPPLLPLHDEVEVEVAL